MSLCKNRPECSPTHFCQNDYMTCTMGKSKYVGSPNICATSVIFIEKCPMQTFTQIDEKIDKSGHPDRGCRLLSSPQWPPTLSSLSWSAVGHDQGDQIGRIFAYWTMYCFLWAGFLITEVAQTFGPLFSHSSVSVLACANILGIFFSSSSVHTGPDLAS
jgi:hypothetical protein